MPTNPIGATMQPAFLSTSSSQTPPSQNITLTAVSKMRGKNTRALQVLVCYNKSPDPSSILEQSVDHMMNTKLAKVGVRLASTQKVDR